MAVGFLRSFDRSVAVGRSVGLSVSPSLPLCSLTEDGAVDVVSVEILGGGDGVEDSCLVFNRNAFEY